MKKRTKLVIAAILMIAFVISAIPVSANDLAYTMTLGEAKELALKNSPKIKQQLAGNEMADVNRRDAWINYEKARANYQNTGGMVEAYKEAMDGARQAYDAAINAVDDSKVILENLKKQVEYETESMYLNLLLMDSNINMMKINYDLQAKMNEVENLKLNLGMSTQFQVDEQRRKAMEMSKQLQELYNTKENLRWQFNRSLGKESTYQIELSPVAFQPIEHGTMSEGQDAAKAAALAIEQFNRTIEDKRHDIEEKKVNASDKVEKLELEIKQYKLNLDDTEYGIDLMMKNLHEKAYLAQKSVVDNRATFDMAKKEFVSQELQYDIGMISRMVFDAARAGYEKKQADYQKAVYEYYLVAHEIKLAEEGIFLD